MNRFVTILLLLFELVHNLLKKKNNYKFITFTKIKLQLTIYTTVRWWMINFRNIYIIKKKKNKSLVCEIEHNDRKKKKKLKLFQNEPNNFLKITKYKR